MKDEKAGARVTFDFRRGVIVVEGTGSELAKLFEHVRAAAPSLKEIRIITTEPGAAVSGQPQLDDESRRERRPALREFARQFTLENTSQRIAVLAYHSIKEGSKPLFSVKDMNDWFGLCGFKKPTQMAVALSDARRKYGYVENKGRDQWTLATGGDNLVLELLESRGANGK